MLLLVLVYLLLTVTSINLLLIVIAPSGLLFWVIVDLDDGVRFYWVLFR